MSKPDADSGPTVKGRLSPHSLAQRVLSRPIASARVVFAIAALLKLAILVPVLARVEDPLRLRVAWPGLPLLPLLVLVPVAVSWLIASVALALNWRPRASGSVLSCCMLLGLLGDQQFYSNHLYLAITLAMLLALAGNDDAGSASSSRAQGSPVVESAAVFALKSQASIVYGFAAITKLNATYVSGAVLFAFLGRESIFGFPAAWRRVEILSTIAVLSIAAEMFLAIGLWLRRWRSGALLLGTLLHGGMVLLLPSPAELVVFALLMMSTYPVFASDGRLPSSVASASKRWISPKHVF